MDDLDNKILGLLQLNAREPVASLARALKTSRSTIQDRITRLEKANIIKGYRLEMEPGQEASSIRAFVIVAVEPQRTQMIVAELKTIRQVGSVHTVSGKFDLQLEVTTETTGEMDKTIDRITEIPGVLKTETSIVLSTKFRR